MADLKKHTPQASANLSLLLWACFIVLALNAIVFTNAVTAAHIRHDVFRHLDFIVLPFLEGHESMAILWSNHHPSPLLHLIQMFSLKFLGFRLDFNAYLGLACQILSTFLILRNAFYRRDGGAPIGPLTALTALLIVAIAFGFNSLDQYTWPLVATVQYLYLFGLLFFLSVDRHLRLRSSGSLVTVLLAAAVCILANADYGTVFIVAISLVLGLVFLFERDKVCFGTALLLLLLCGGYHFLLSLMSAEEAGASTTGGAATYAVSLLGRPWYVLQTFALGLTSGLIDLVSIKARFPQAVGLLEGFAVLNALGFIVIFFTYFVRGLHRITITPPALMLLSVFFSASVMIFRWWVVGDDVWGLTTERYIPTHKLSVMGALWALFLIARSVVPAKNNVASISRLGPVAAAAIVAVLLIQLAQIYAGWKQAPELIRHHDQLALGVYLAGTRPENKIGLPVRVAGFTSDGRNIRKVLSYLRKHELNVFAPGFPAGSLLGHHIESRKQFKRARPTTKPETQSTTKEATLPHEAIAGVDWEQSAEALKIGNQGSSPIYIRVEIEGGRFGDDALALTLFSAESQTTVMDSFKGRQSLYFTLAAGESLTLESLRNCAISTFELRRG